MPFQVGDSVIRNDHAVEKSRVKLGEKGVVVRMDNDTLTVRLESGSSHRLMIRKWDHIPPMLICAQCEGQCPQDDYLCQECRGE